MPMPRMTWGCMTGSGADGGTTVLNRDYNRTTPRSIGPRAARSSEQPLRPKITTQLLHWFPELVTNPPGPYTVPPSRCALRRFLLGTSALRCGALRCCWHGGATARCATRFAWHGCAEARCLAVLLARLRTARCPTRFTCTSALTRGAFVRGAVARLRLFSLCGVPADTSALAGSLWLACAWVVRCLCEHVCA